MESVLYFWNGQALFIGESIDTCEHQHYAVQISIGISHPFHLFSSNQWDTYDAVIIAPNHLHQFDGSGECQAILLIDPETKIGQFLLQKYLQNCNVMELDGVLFRTGMHDFRNHMSHKYSCQNAKRLRDGVLNTLLWEPSVTPKTIDPRVQQALHLIQQSPTTKVSSKTIAKHVCLSESRFTHLFTEQVGIPIRRYLLWQRLIRGIRVLLNGDSLTSAAHEVGFADSAHFSRTFKKMFGITPSEIFKNSQFVQAISCLD